MEGRLWKGENRTAEAAKKREKIKRKKKKKEGKERKKIHSFVIEYHFGKL